MTARLLSVHALLDPFGYEAVDEDRPRLAVAVSAAHCLRNQTAGGAAARAQEGDVKAAVAQRRRRRRRRPGGGGGGGGTGTNTCASCAGFHSASYTMTREAHARLRPTPPVRVLMSSSRTPWPWKVSTIFSRSCRWGRGSVRAHTRLRRTLRVWGPRGEICGGLARLGRVDRPVKPQVVEPLPPRAGRIEPRRRPVTQREGSRRLSTRSAAGEGAGRRRAPSLQHLLE